MSSHEKWWRVSIGADICQNCAVQLVNNKLVSCFTEGSFIACRWNNIKKTHPSVRSFFTKLPSRVSTIVPDDELQEENDDDDSQKTLSPSDIQQ